MTIPCPAEEANPGIAEEPAARSAGPAGPADLAGPDTELAAEPAAPPATQLDRRAGIRAGITDSLGVGLGIFPLGLALGILIAQAGLPWWLAPALSIGIFAGSVELLLVSLLAAATPLVTIAVAVFAVNFRHVFYALSFPITKVRKGLPRAYATYAMIDEAYATYVLMPEEKISSARIVTGQLMMQAYWVVGGLIGIAIANALPAPIEGFEFALTSLFIVMTLDAVRSRREIPAVLLAGLSVGVAMLAAPGQSMLVALILYTVLLAVRYALGARRRDADAAGRTGAEGSDA
ncbi:AzlC family ABC transporter permease [Leucobacter sp. CSA2]|uniref:AzlC family ABC transporter permease n=1 Tax=Leucobacter edaphi TaxID=2796472 RepID=A0A934UWU6_9MICO|nr:AzlC family ABC transporter permease [Leucobacter edaphi]MBK0420906.1 AzlC family ABC transporter permease [Leucobacter edaphi]